MIIKTVQNYDLIKSLGKGVFAETFLAKNKLDNQLYAVKQLKKEVADKPENRKYLDSEISNLKKLQHKNIIQYYGAVQTANNYYIITSYANGGALYDALNEYKLIHDRPFPEEIVQHLMIQIVDALKYMHSLKIIHRDIKLENILLHYPTEEDKKSRNLMKAMVKFIDFGFSFDMTKGVPKTGLGTPCYMAPTILEKNAGLKNSIVYDEKADIWSLGILFYEMLEGKTPFDGYDSSELIQKIKAGKYSLPYPLSKDAILFLSCMLRNKPEERLPAAKLFIQPFLVNYSKKHKI